MNIKLDIKNTYILERSHLIHLYEKNKDVFDAIVLYTLIKCIDLFENEDGLYRIFYENERRKIDLVIEIICHLLSVDFFVKGEKIGNIRKILWSHIHDFIFEKEIYENPDDPQFELFLRDFISYIYNENSEAYCFDELDKKKISKYSEMILKANESENIFKACGYSDLKKPGIIFG